VVFNKEIHQSEKNLAFFRPGCIRNPDGLDTDCFLAMCDDGEDTSTTGSDCQPLSPSESGGRVGRNPQR